MLPRDPTLTDVARLSSPEHPLHRVPALGAELAGEDGAEASVAIIEDPGEAVLRVGGRLLDAHPDPP